MTPILRPYQFIGTPAISLLLDAIAAHCIVGELIAPGVRQLAEWAGVSEGCVSPCLRQLVKDGWIDYDGRMIMLWRSPDQCVDREGDQTVDPQGDQAADRVDQRLDRALDQCVDRVLPAQPNAAYRVSNRDRVETGRMVSIINKQQQVAVVRDSGGSGGVEPIPAAALLLAELGADQKIIADALRERPDLTGDQVRETWAWHQERIAQSDGRLNDGVFYHAIRRGQIHAAPPDPATPLDPAAYADDPAFKLGGDVSPPDDAQQRQAAYADAHWRAVALLGPGAPFREMAVLVERLVAGDSDQAALAALTTWRSAVRS